MKHSSSLKESKKQIYFKEKAFCTKIWACRLATLLKEAQARYFLVNFANCLKKLFYRIYPDDCYTNLLKAIWKIQWYLEKQYFKHPCCILQNLKTELKNPRQRWLFLFSKIVLFSKKRCLRTLFLHKICCNSKSTRIWH